MLGIFGSIQYEMFIVLQHKTHLVEVEAEIAEIASGVITCIARLAVSERLVLHCQLNEEYSFLLSAMQHPTPFSGSCKSFSIPIFKFFATDEIVTISSKK